ncbi:hypothetical protein C8024_19520, partial [Sphingopyxis sp. BSNA05]|uniref:hypothetical protein n=1 Tax=Sphingopyxis sp. BSNA05 TaxID=1236614 RepID=UPI001C2729CD
FILEFLPHGIIGLLLVAIMSAAMSTLSSAVNSLSAVTIADLKGFGLQLGNARQEIRLARLLALFWGGLILYFRSIRAIFLPRSSKRSTRWDRRSTARFSACS